MIKARLAVSVGLILALCAMAGPRTIHADAVAASGCAASASPTTISPLTMTFTGRTTDALPVPPATATVATTTISGTVDYGLFDDISGIKPVEFPNAENEITDFFTFATTVMARTDVLSGAFLASSRTGTLTVYLGHGDFSAPVTFSSGTPIMTASFSQQILVTNPAVLITPPALRFASVNLGVVGGTAVVSGAAASLQLSLPGGPLWFSRATATITSVSLFTYGGACYQLGATGKTLTITSVGQFDSPTAIAGNLNGAITGM
jgi:hypothetical protein